MTRRIPRARVRGLDWLAVLDVDGPFLAAPVLRDVFPAGLPALDAAAVRGLREASTALDANPGTRDPLIHHVLRDFLGWRQRYVHGPDLPAGLDVPVVEYHTVVRPTFALLPPAGDETPTPLLIGMVLPAGTRPTARPRGADPWSAAPADRLAHALRHHRIPLGLITDGTDWTLVAAPEAGPTSMVTWTRHTWLDEPDTLKAFHALLGRQRFFGVAAEHTLPAMLADSLRRQEELTDRLSQQAHAAVEMLVATLGRADAEARANSRPSVLPDYVTPGEVYEASVTLLMRLLFLLYAEERGLLPADDDTYAAAYAVSNLTRQLRDRADEIGEGALERSTGAWHRLLALFRAVHRGARHHTLNLNAYGGSLFDPDRFPWLEGRSSRDLVTADIGVPPMDDRTILRALEALTQVRVPGEPEPRTVSFAVLDVEQIGYVYEGLLGQDAIRADTWILGVIGDTRGYTDGPEIPLYELEAQLAKGVDVFATWLAAQVKEAGGSLTSTAILKRLSPIEDSLEAERRVRPVCGGREQIVARVLPFERLLRRDPRNLPVVYAPDSLYLTESSLRASTGAVYTPRWLAEQVVTGALEPLVYQPGPLDTEDRDLWRIRTPEEILNLKIIDLAAGSGAFLVSAARYLATALLEACAVHRPDDPRLRADPDRRQLDAIRAVIDHCIYGVDVNPMALEMAKLSLWVISLDKTRPFGFLDDRLAVGDSLLGITHPDQLRDLHLDPAAGRALHEDTLDLYTFDTDRLLKDAAEIRRRIAEIDLNDSRDADHKRRLLDQATTLTGHLTQIADALSAASLAGGRDGDYLRVAALVAGITEAAKSGEAAEQQAWDELESHARFGLTSPGADEPHRPAHFPLLFPEVFTNGSGFDAVTGNPPFLGGQKLTGTFGTDYREHLVRALGHGARGSADLVAYMALRAFDLLASNSGQLGLIATNTLAQGDTREVGLDQLTAAGLDIRAAVKSSKWPTQGANLEYSVVWGSRRPRHQGVRAMADGQSVPAITPSLDRAGRVTGNPHRLVASQGISFIGSYVLGLGFMMSPERARELIAADPRSSDVLFPYLNGEDLNSRPDCSASRWVINFHNWPLEQAEKYPEPMRQVRALVKPNRDQISREQRRKHWWQYAERAPELYEETEGLDRILVLAQVSRTVQPAFVLPGQVFSHKLVVFATDDSSLLCLLASAPHYWWAIRYSATMRVDLSYSPTDVFQTLSLPPLTDPMREAGERLHEERSALMLERDLGLTKTYKLVHDPGITNAGIVRLRELHREVDAAVCAAYGWTDLDLGHGHHETRQGVRYTVAPAVQLELVDRLLELNHARFAMESTAGVRPKSKGIRRSPMVSTGRKTAADDKAQGRLFEMGGS